MVTRKIPNDSEAASALAKFAGVSLRSATRAITHAGQAGTYSGRHYHVQLLLAEDAYLVSKDNH